MRNIQKNDYWFSFINVQVYQINQNIKSDHEMKTIPESFPTFYLNFYTVKVCKNCTVL